MLIVCATDPEHDWRARTDYHRPVARVVALIALVVLGAACGGPPPAKTVPRLEQATFRIGFARLTRRDDELGRATALAAEQFNAKGGVAGAVRIEFVLADEAGEPADVARRLLQRGVNALMLACDAAAAAAQAEVAQRTEVLAFMPCVDDPTIPARYPNVWPVSLPANAEAAALADFALTRRYPSAKVVGGGRIAEYVERALPARHISARGGDVTIFTGAALKLPPSRPLLGTHLLDTSTFAETPAAEGITFTTYGFPTQNSAAHAFYRAFSKRYGRDPSGSWVALGYDVVRVLATAMEEAGSSDPDIMLTALGNGLTVEGGLGTITYPGSWEHLPETAVAVVQVRHGKRVLVEKSLPEEVPSP
jgi:ABC-type branched-subunit amino acid transport system substrate-binding protein